MFGCGHSERERWKRLAEKFDKPPVDWADRTLSLPERIAARLAAPLCEGDTEWNEETDRLLEDCAVVIQKMDSVACVDCGYLNPVLSEHAQEHATGPDGKPWFPEVK